MTTGEEESGFVTVATFLDPAEAQMARSALEAEGIAVFLQGENANSMVPLGFRVRAQVAVADEAAARELLAAAGEVEPEGEDEAV